jgi:hypothetical protein
MTKGSREGIMYEGEEWINLAKNGVWWQILVNVAMKYRVPKKLPNLTSVGEKSSPTTHLWKNRGERV